MQQRLEELNPTWITTSDELSKQLIRADGDLDLKSADYSKFIVPSCKVCKSGILKPGERSQQPNNPLCFGNFSIDPTWKKCESRTDLVFFGSNVPKETVEFSKSLVDHSEALIAIGTSLEVYSVYRFIDQALQQKKPVMSINIGKTRADGLLHFKWEANASRGLFEILRLLE